MQAGAAIDANDVRLAVCALLGRDAGVSTWVAEDVEHHQVHSTTAWLSRLRGVTSDGDDWSLVIKATMLGAAEPGALWTSAADPAHRNYWKREFLAFESGLLGALPGRLRAPRCLLTTEPAAGEAWMWLEDVAGTSGRHWSVEHFVAAAGDLGTTQGAFAAGAELPSAAWVSRSWLRSWLADTSAAWEEGRDDAAAWRDDRLAPLLPLRAAIDELAGRQEALLDIVDQAPQTVIHGDFWPPNLFHAPTGETVAVDWSSVGIGSIAHDLDQLTLDPVWMQLREPDWPDVVERAVLSAYADGLRAAGADIGDAELRRWYAAAAAAHFGLNAGLLVRAIARPDQIAAQQARWGRPYAEIVARRAIVIDRALRLGAECLA